MDVINYIATHALSFYLCVTFLSLMVGSFLNVIIYRLPRMIEYEWSQECRQYLGLKPAAHETSTLGLCLPASHCPTCHKSIKPWHNIPIISYLFLGGKCANCSAKISMRYPFVEALTCLASLYIAACYGFSLQTVGALFFTWSLIALTFIDFDSHLLPDGLNFFIAGLGLVLSLYNVFCTPQDAIIGLVSGYLIFATVEFLFHKVTGKVGMGQGDYKLLAALGAFLGWQMLPLIILLSSLTGLVFGLSYIVIKQTSRNVPLPFGPYLAIAGWIALLWGNEILKFYLHLFH